MFKIKKISLRFLVQLSIVALVVILAWLHQKYGIEKAAAIDAYCPFGAVESFFTLLFKGEFLARIFSSAFILLGIFLIGGLFLGRVFCGYFCPLGALQEWLRYIGKKIGFKKDLEIPEKFDKYLRLIKYLVLIVIVYYSFYLGDLIFRNYDPYNALMHFGNEFDEKIIAYILLFLIIVGSLFSKSIWCRYFCPLGAFFGIFKKISFLKINRDKSTCINCNLCNKQCPSRLKIMEVDKVKAADCISCGKCISVCPKKSLDYTIFNQKISKNNFTWLMIVIVILPLIIAPFTPWWQSKAESNIVNTTGEINTADIRGSNTLQYVIEVTKVPLSEFQLKLLLPKNVDTSLKLKEIGLKYNLVNSEGNVIETEDFRAVINNYIENKSKPEVKTADCPFGEVDCEFPGECGAYIDTNADRICDHSY